MPIAVAVVGRRRRSRRRRRIPQNSKIQKSRRGSGEIFGFLNFASYVSVLFYFLFLFLILFLFTILISFIFRGSPPTGDTARKGTSYSLFLSFQESSPGFRPGSAGVPFWPPTDFSQLIRNRELICAKITSD